MGLTCDASVDMQALDALYAYTAAQTDKPLLCRYVETFDQQTMLEMTQVVSAEGAALVEAQTSALFGDLKQLQRQMQASFLYPVLPLYCQLFPAVVIFHGDMSIGGRHPSNFGISSSL